MKSLETKKEIRHKIIRLRKEMDPLVWQQATNDITERVINHPRFLEETDIYCYANYNGEVGTSSIMEEAWKLGKSVWFPRIEGSEMNFYLVESKDDLQPGAYGILEPTGDHIADGEDGLLIMPGVAFDEECHRIGYGGGFYDKYLEKLIFPEFSNFLWNSHMHPSAHPAPPSKVRLNQLLSDKTPASDSSEPVRLHVLRSG